MTRSAIRACLNSASFPVASISMPDHIRSHEWSSVASHTVVPFEKFPGSPSLRTCWHEVFLAATKPLLSPSPPEAAWKLLALLPWLLFQRPANKLNASTIAATLHGRLRLFLCGDMTALIQAASSNEQQWRHQWEQPRSGAPDPEGKIISRAQTLARQGDLSRAAKILSSSATLLDPSTDDDTAQKVRASLVSTRYPDSAPQGSAAVTPLPTQTISAADARQAIASMAPSAAGPTGWHISTIKALATNEACLDRLAAILSLLLQANLPEPFLALISSGSLTALSKDNGGVRPIITRSTWLRLLSKCIVRREQPALSRALAPVQCGVGMPGGSELIVHSVRLLLEKNPSWTLTTVDAANAFGTVSRSAIRTQLLASEAPHELTLRYFDRFCAPPFAIRQGSNFHLSVAEGVIQGDPLSPLSFALALQPALEETTRCLRAQHPDARLFAYLDDVCFVGPASASADAFACLKRAVLKAGLQVNDSKTTMFSPSMTASDAVPADLENLRRASGGKISWPTMNLLGSVLASDSVPPVSCDLTPSEDARLFSRLDSVPSLQLRLLLLRLSVARSYLHRLRSSPPGQTASLAHRVDGLIATSLARLCGTRHDEQLPPSTLREACLPAALGGLGVPCLTDTKLVAYSASVLATIQHWRKYVPDSDPLLAAWSASPSLASAVADMQPIIKAASTALKCPIVFPVSAQAAVVFSNVSQLQRRLQGYRDLVTVCELKNNHLSTNLDRAQFLSKTSRGACAFLQACPTDVGLRLSNDDTRLSLRLWLRLPILPVFGAPSPTPCFCRAGVTLDEQHILNCNGEAARDARHNTLVLCIQEMLQASVHSPVLLEPRVGLNSQDFHRFDLSVKSFDSASRHLKLDVTIRNPQAKHVVARAAHSNLVAAHDAAREKFAKYGKYLTSSDLFLPLAVESFGGLHPNVFQLVSACARRVANVAPDSSCFLAPTFSSYWLQRISCTLMRENCKLINSVVGQSLRQVGIQREDSFALHMADFPEVAPSESH